MAKSVRASVSKRNKAKLRATVFGPVVDARTERLSAKLQELASQPKTNEHEKSDVGSDTAGIGMSLYLYVFNMIFWGNFLYKNLH